MPQNRAATYCYALSTGERCLVGSFAYDDAAFRDTASWASAHATELAPLIEARVDLDEAPETFRALADGTLTAGKVLIYPARGADGHVMSEISG